MQPAAHRPRRRRSTAPSGSGKSSTSRGVADRARPALPRHRRDVPRHDLVDAAQGRRRARRRRGRRPRAREPAIVSGTDPRGPDHHGRRHRRGRPRSAATEVTAAVSPGQRGPRGAARLLELQRDDDRRGGRGGIVVEGRDIGSVVAPDAAGEGLPDRRPGRPRRAPRRRGGRRRRRRDPQSLLRRATGSTPAARPRRWRMADGAVHIDTTPYTPRRGRSAVVALVEAVEARA